MGDARSVAAPVTIDVFPNGEIGIVWKDGHESIYSAHDLRCQCRCAACVDEVSGRKILDETTVSDEIRAEALQAVGNYGVTFHWSDGHGTGIYPHALLRSLCACEACKPTRA